MPEKTLTQRQLNRTLLDRQMLLEREQVKPLQAIEQLVAMQAEKANMPYIGLWARLKDFTRDQLTQLMFDREVVRVQYLRSTMHLVPARDYAAMRASVQPALTRALGAFFGQKAKGLEVAAIVRAARQAIEGEPQTFVKLRALLLGLYPDRDAEAMAYAVRTHLPMVQIPPAGTWGVGGSPAHALAETWIDAPYNEDDDPRPLIRRYLAAFGPSSLRDAQAWSGFVRFKATMDALESELVTYQDEKGVTLYDLPTSPIIDEDTPAPVRFLPELDNLILSHFDRTRIIAAAYRPRVFLPAARVRSTFLVDGYVAGAWKIEKARRAATLIIEPFAPLEKRAREEVAAEGERLLRWVADDAETFEVTFKDE